MGRPDQERPVTLLRLTIENFGLIEHAAFEFADGLTVFSGETGSGKTMLLGALGFALGERADADMIRAGAARARVTLELAPDDAVRDLLATAGFELAPDDDAILTRELAANGRSQARINGQAASASQLRDLGAALIDIVGQHEAQRLLAPAFALDVVDRFGGAPLAVHRTLVRESFRARQAALAERAALLDDDGRLRAQLEFARFAAAEIDDAALAADDEDERLRERRDVLANAEKIASALSSAEAALEDDGGGVDALGSAASTLASIARYGAAFGTLASAAGALQSEANDLAARIARERDAIDVDPGELETLGARLDVLERLKKKYGPTIAAIKATRAQFAETIDRDDRRDGDVAAVEARIAALDAELARGAAALTNARTAAARDLEALVQTELAALAMPAARFRIAFEPLATIGAHGAERAELRLAPNPGEPERPIAKSASGGELSRVLLALIVALADRRERTALVFDEIDAGIGGATANAVGARLGRLARDAQVVVVTHLAQIASWAGAHYALRKRDAAGTTVIELEDLAGNEARLAEIARMLSGEATPVSLEHAATLVAGTRGA
jgi:DNA repair protein RecN (Recombination protein N)